MRHLTTRRPIGNLFNLHNEMGRVFGDMLSSQDSETNAENTSWIPTVDISETENSFEIHAELPGVVESDVNVSVTDNLLTIKGEKQQEEKAEGKNFHRVERRYGSFQRSFTLPKNVETADIKAGFKDGVLALTIPKAEAAKPTEIPISVNS
ncbi:MAG: Hsp20/alpha crystallin family protein [Candidatus Poribacteria bacterium]|nr:Hsp20/alpha crystallin family protein [Candidatus Poribacteria bacterium]